VNLARASLLPSINLGFGATLGDSYSFALANVSFLLPFLLPSKWFDVKKSERLLEPKAIPFML